MSAAFAIGKSFSEPIFSDGKTIGMKICCSDKEVEVFGAISDNILFLFSSYIAKEMNNGETFPQKICLDKEYSVGYIEKFLKFLSDDIDLSAEMVARVKKRMIDAIS